MATRKIYDLYNSSFRTEDGQLIVNDEVRVSSEKIQKGDKFFVVEEYAAVITRIWTAPDGAKIPIGERIPVVKLDRNGKPVGGTVLWVSQLCPKDVARCNVYETPIYEARQKGALIAEIKGKVLTAVEVKRVLMCKWDEKVGYLTNEDGSFVGVEREAFRFSAAKPASVVDVAAATTLLKEYLENNYGGILNK